VGVAPKKVVSGVCFGGALRAALRLAWRCAVLLLT